MLTPAGSPVIVAVTGAEPFVGAPPVLMTVISYRPVPPCRNAPSTALSTVRPGTPTIGVGVAVEADGRARRPAGHGDGVGHVQPVGRVLGAEAGAERHLDGQRDRRVGLPGLQD